MNFTKKALTGTLIAVSLAIPLQANAGFVGKVIKGGALITAGVVIYKVIKKLNIGNETQNLANYPDNIVPYLTENPNRVEYVVLDLEKILNSPELAPGKGEVPTNYLVLSRIIQANFNVTVNEGPWTGIPVDSPNLPSSTVASKPKNVVINGGTLVANEDEQILEKNMRMVGFGNKPDGYKAFHLVSSSGAGYQVLKSVGIDINSAVNGVYLPIDKANTLRADSQYNNDLENLLKQAYAQDPSSASIENVLNMTRQVLSK